MYKKILNLIHFAEIINKYSSETFEKKLNDSISITNGSFTAPCIGKYKLNNNKYVYLYKGKTYTLSELSNDATSITEVYCQGSSE